MEHKFDKIINNLKWLEEQDLPQEIWENHYLPVIDRLDILIDTLRTYILLMEQGLDIANLVDQHFEILPKPKRVGELDCFVEIKCNNCPLRMISGCTNSEGVPLYDILKEIQIDSTKNNMFDQEIYDLLKARLDKEVE